MTRKKVNLTFITDDSKRKATLRKRKNGLIKKIDEISTLCGIEACAVIYSPNDPQPVVWPSPGGVQRVLSRFRRMPELEQSKNMLNQQSLLNQMIQKTQEQLNKQRNENRKKEMTHLMFEYLNAGKIFGNVNLNDLNDLSWLIDQNLKEIEGKINQIQAQDVVENTPTIVSGGEQQCMGPNQMLETNAIQAQEVVENTATIMSGGEQQYMDLDQMLDTNVNAMQTHYRSMDFNNGCDLPFGDINDQNDFWTNPQVPWDF